MEDTMLLGLQQMIDAEAAGQVWLNSIPAVNQLLYDLQRVAWMARINEGKHQITRAKREYLVSAEVSKLVQIFEGRHPGYAALPWNTDPGQMKQHIIKQFWADSEPEDAPTIDDVLPRTLDDCAAAAVFGVEAQLPDCHPTMRQTAEQVAEELQDARHRTGACLIGVPLEIFSKMAGED